MDHHSSNPLEPEGIHSLFRPSPVPHRGAVETNFPLG